MLELSTLRKMSIFTEDQRVTVEIFDIHPEAQKLARYAKNQME